MSTRDRRAVLWLCCAAVCWRWFVGMRTPLPGVDACRDLWLAQRLAVGDFAELAASWWEPLPGLLLAPLLSAGLSPFTAAQVFACVMGGLVVVPVSLAAERLREGAGVSAGVLATVAAGPVVAAGAGAATALSALLVGAALWAFAQRRLVTAAVLVAIVAAAFADQVAGRPRQGFEALRLAGGAAVSTLPLLLLAPRSRRFLAPIVVLLLVAAVAAWRDAWLALLPTWSPGIAVLGGVGLSRLPMRLRDAALCVVVVVECHAAWTLVEAPAAVAERIVGQLLARRERLPIATDLPRVAWAAGQRPAAVDLTFAESVVLGYADARSATVRAGLAARFAHADLPPDLADLAAEHGLVVLTRR